MTAEVVVPYFATVFSGHLHKSAMMHLSHKGLRATQV